MSHARSAFFERKAVIKNLVEKSFTVDKSPDQKEHNSQARLLRNGLAIMNFLALEDFIKSRMAEILEGVSQSGVSFEDLPEKLKKGAIEGALDGLRMQANLEASNGGDKQSLIQEHCDKIASTSLTTFYMSEFSFGHEKSNINHDHVSQILKAFRIEKPWDGITRLGSRSGAGLPDFKEEFEKAFRSRNLAAHDASANLQSSDLETQILATTAIAFSIDCFLTNALMRIKDRNTDYLSMGRLIKADEISLRFIFPKDGYWKEKLESGKRVINKAAIKADCIARARNRRSAQKDTLVILDSNSRPDEWETPI